MFFEKAGKTVYYASSANNARAQQGPPTQDLSGVLVQCNVMLGFYFIYFLLDIEAYICNQ